jgi:predicted lipid-binding transport protein (Tim44 family)
VIDSVFDIYTIIFLALAIFIFARLRSVLGQRTGRERPPYDPYSARDPIRTNDKVVALPGRAPDTAQKSSEPAEPAERWKGPRRQVKRSWNVGDLDSAGRDHFQAALEQSTVWNSHALT